MAIKVMIKRHFKEDKTEEGFELLNKFRSEALKKPGYISGETLLNHYDPRHVLVISTWQTIDDWIRWEESNERESIESQLEPLLDGPTNFEVYDLGMSPNKQI